MTIVAEFPAEGLLPKSEVGALNFLKKYPEYDGRSIVMAILDTGVDPAASGLQLTANGLPKIVDIVDATGSGDVILGDTVKATEAADGSLTLTGISGKTLKVSKQWKNPTGEFRLGLKRQVDLYPGGVAKRAAARRKEAFEKKHNILLAEAVNDLKEWELKHPKPSTPEELSEQANLESIVACLNKEMENYEDDLFYDVVVFHDGQDYRAVLDLCQNGDLTSVKPLADYKLYREYDYFDHADEVTFNVKFYDDGKLLSIVCSAGSHATHVAAIASAYFPNDPVLNGVAPSSQIVSIKIGDTRLGSMETKSALKRSIAAMIDNNVHLANLSYGEDAAFHNKGTWIKSLQDSIEKHNIVFVSSAGNAGPNICTVGAPGGTSSSVVSVGAYATASMIKAEYALLNQVNETPFTWSSRGPTLDGEKGVTVYAPGAAITSVPKYNLKNSQLMNGTSMASPLACGCIALLLSGLNARNIIYNPYSVKKAVENSSKNFNDPLGVGLIQVEAAFDYFVKYKEHDDLFMNFAVTLPGRNNARGLFIKNERDYFNGFVEEEVSVDCVFRNDDHASNERRLRYEQRLTLVQKYPASFIKAPDFVFMNTGGRQFQISVDTTALTQSGLYYNEIQAIDSKFPDKGPVFTIPITFLKPETLNDNKFVFEKVFSPGHIERLFFLPPSGCTFAKVKIRLGNSNTDPSKEANNVRFSMETMQLLDNEKKFTKDFHFALRNSKEEARDNIYFDVVGGKYLEVNLSSFWSSSGVLKVSLEIDFMGIMTNGSTGPISLRGMDAFTTLNFYAPLKQVEFNPTLTLSGYRRHLTPSGDRKIKSLLSKRDIIAEGKVSYEVIINYTLKITEEKSFTLEPFIKGHLYESPFESFLLMVFNEHKRRVFFSDVFSKSVKLSDKGTYTIQVELRHENQDLLDKLQKSLVFVVEGKLSKPITLSLYDDIYELYSGKKKTLPKFIQPKQEISTVVDLLVNVEDGITSSDLLIGDISFASGNYKVGLLFDVAASSSSKSSDDNATVDLTLEEKKKELLLGLVLQKNLKLEERTKVMNDLVSSYPKDVAVLKKQIEFLLPTLKETAAKDKIVAACDTIISVSDQKEIQLFLLEKVPPAVSNSTEYKQKKTKYSDLKSTLAFAYYLKCCILLEDKDDKVSECFNSLSKLIDIESDIRYVFLNAALKRHKKQYGSALKIVATYLKANFNSTTKTENLITFAAQITESLNDVQKLCKFKQLLLKDLLFDCWVEHEERKFVVAFPKGYETF